MVLGLVLDLVLKLLSGGLGSWDVWGGWVGLSGVGGWGGMGFEDQNVPTRRTRILHFTRPCRCSAGKNLSFAQFITQLRLRPLFLTVCVVSKSPSGVRDREVLLEGITEIQGYLMLCHARATEVQGDSQQLTIVLL